MSLLQKIKQNKNITVQVGELTFLGTRATHEQFARYSIGQMLDAEIARLHINGWVNVKESDLVEDGKDKPVEFEKELFDEVIGDHREWYSVIAKAVIANAIKIYTEKAQNEKK